VFFVVRVLGPVPGLLIRRCRKCLGCRCSPPAMRAEPPPGLDQHCAEILRELDFTG
jgi:hypothetical protein